MPTPHNTLPPEIFWGTIGNSVLILVGLFQQWLHRRWARQDSMKRNKAIQITHEEITSAKEELKKDLRQNTELTIMAKKEAETAAQITDNHNKEFNKRLEEFRKQIQNELAPMREIANGEGKKAGERAAGQ